MYCNPVREARVAYIGMTQASAAADDFHANLRAALGLDARAYARMYDQLPEVAASVHRKPEGYLLVAVTEGHPVVNGAKVATSVVLKEGDMIDCGATTMMFELR